MRLGLLGSCHRFSSTLGILQAEPVFLRIFVSWSEVLSQSPQLDVKAETAATPFSTASERAFYDKTILTRFRFGT